MIDRLTRPDADRAPARRTHLSDYVAVVRRRKRAFLATAFLVFTAWIALTLYRAPVYTAAAMLQVQTEGAASGLLGDLQALHGGPPTEAEIEIMRSRAVAGGAFQRLAPGDFLEEAGRYRPIDTLLDRFRGARPEYAVELETDPLAPGAAAETYVFRFEDATRVRVSRRGRTRVFWDDGHLGTDTVRFESGVPFTVHGRTFTVTVDGDVTGRAYRLGLLPPDEGAEWVQRGTRVTEVGRLTGVVRVHFAARTPRLARRVAGALARSYLDLKTEHRREHARTALQFVRTETERVREKLDRAEERLDAVRARAGAVALSDHALWLVQKGSELELERATRGLEAEEFRRLRAFLPREGGMDRALGALRGVADPMTRALTEQIARLELERDVLVERGVKEAHPRRRETERELAAARTRLEAALDGALAQAERKSRAEEEHLAATVVRLEEQVHALPEREREVTQLTREVKAQLEIHAFLVQKEQEAQIAEASALASARLIDEPLRPRYRTSPRIFTQLFIAFAVALALAVMLALFLDYLDRSVRTPVVLEEAAAAPLFAAVPDFRTVRGRSMRGWRGALAARDRPTSTVSEAYRTLRTNLRFARSGEDTRCVAITSSLPGEGKSVTNANLAIVSAQIGDETLLIDADLRKPTVHTLFDLPRGPGLREVLTGDAPWRDALQRSGTEGLSILTAGGRTRTPGALLDARFRALLEELKGEFAQIVIDVPPILAVADAATFLPSLDGVLLACRDRACLPHVVADAAARVRRIGAPLLGVVFNGFDARRSDVGGYGYYGEYGGDEEDDPAPRRRPAVEVS